MKIKKYFFSILIYILTTTALYHLTVKHANKKKTQIKTGDAEDRVKPHLNSQYIYDHSIHTVYFIWLDYLYDFYFL